MFYEFTDDIVTVDMDKINSNTIVAGYIPLSDLESAANYFGFSPTTVGQCSTETKYFHSNIEVYDDYIFGTIKIANAENMQSNKDCVAFYIKKNMLLIVDVSDEDCSTRDKFMDSLRRFNVTSITLEKVIYSFLSSLVEGDNKILEDMEFEINNLEEFVVNDKADSNFNIRLLEMKKDLLVLRNYYEQMIDVGEALYENENEIFENNDLRYFKILTSKSIRLRETVDVLRESVVHLRDAYQSYLDLKLNETMKLFTVITAIFLPLTLIAGWYGMNFNSMPEFNWKYGYIGVICLSVLVVVSLVYLFKKKKWI